MSYDLEAQKKEVARELAMRKNVYAKWVRGKRMTQEEADRRIDTMQAVYESLARLEGLEA